MSLNKEKIIELLPNVAIVKAEDVEKAVIEYINSEHLFDTHSLQQDETDEILGKITIYHYFVSCSISRDYESGGYRLLINVIDRVKHCFSYLYKISKGRFEVELSPNETSIYILLKDVNAFDDIKEWCEKVGFDFCCERKYPERNDGFSYIQLVPNEDKIVYST